MAPATRRPRNDGEPSGQENWPAARGFRGQKAGLSRGLRFSKPHSHYLLQSSQPPEKETSVCVF